MILVARIPIVTCALCVFACTEPSGGSAGEEAGQTGSGSEGESSEDEGTDGGTGTGTGDGTESTDEAGETGCEESDDGRDFDVGWPEIDCFDTDAATEAFTCDLIPQPCPVVEAAAADMGGLEVTDVAAAKCAITALRDREEVHIVLRGDYIDHVDEDHVWMIVQWPGHTMTQRARTQDDQTTWYAPFSTKLHHPNFFESCLASDDPAQLWACLDGMTTYCYERQLPCPAC